MAYRLYRGSLVKEENDRFFDPFFLAMIDHHVLTDEEREDVIGLTFEQVAQRSLPTLFKYIGHRRPILTPKFFVDVYGHKQVTVALEFPGEQEISWRGNVLSGRAILPESMISNLSGKPIGSLVQHPYIPKDLIIDTIAQTGLRWEVSFRL